jgi:PKD repeat protein
MEMKPKFKITAVSPVLLLVMSLVCAATESYAKLNDTTVQISDKTFPGQHSAKILKYNVTLSKTDPAVYSKVSKFYFSTKGSTDTKDISNARLYYTGSTDFTNLPLNVADTAGAAVKSPAGGFIFFINKQLHAGNNYFLLTFDVSLAATTGDLLDATLDSVMINDTLKPVPSGNPRGARFIDASGTYCNVLVALPNTKSPQFIGIRNVKIGKAINNASADLDKLTSYTSPKITVYRQESFPVEIKYGQGNNEQIIGWVDWNNDGIFDPATEEVFYTASASPGETYKTIVNVPCTAVAGSHKLRIMDDIDTVAKLTPCSKLLYGEAEEYIVDVQQDVYPYKISFAHDTPTLLGSPIVFTNTSNIRGNVNCEWCFSSVCFKVGFFEAQGNTVSNTWPANQGKYAVKMKLTWQGCDSTVIKTITDTVNVVPPPAPPVSSFIASDNIADTTTIIQLTDLSTGKPGSWYWQINPAKLNGQPSFSFLNGTNYYSQNPVLKFNHTGKYDVTLFAHNGSGINSITKKGYISILKYAGMCSATDTITASSGFLYDDGGKDHPYGYKKSCFVVIKPPCATAINISFRSFDVSTLGPGLDNLKIFDSTNSQGVPLHKKAGYPYGFMNINPGNVPTLPPSVVANSGTAFIQWQTDSAFVGDGFTAYWSAVLKTSAPPKARFVVQDSVYIHHTVTFTNSSTGPEIRSFWDLNGDGIIDNTHENPTYRFDSIGTFNVRLVAVNCGGVDTFYKKITVIHNKTKPKALYSTNYSRIGSGDLLQFFDHSTQNPYKWQWIVTPPNNSYGFNFINSDAGSQNPVIQFFQPGNYSIALVATNEYGSDTIVKDTAVTVEDYCKPHPINLSNSIGISRVVITNRQKDTILDQRSSCGVNGYTQFRNFVPVPMVQYDQYTVTVFRDTNLAKIRGAVMVDYYHSSFHDSIDTVVSAKNITAKSWSGTFPVRKFIDGIGRIRIGVFYYNQPVSMCGDVSIGEFEDYTVTFQKDTIPPVIHLKGNDTLVLEEFSSFSDPGATVSDATDGDITYKLVKAGKVNTAVQGLYKITYNAIDNTKNKAKEVVRVVKIIGDTTRPAITLFGDETEYLEVYDPYFEDSAWVADNIDTGLTLTIAGTVDTSHTGTYFISYTSTDLSGNTAVKFRKVIVIDTIAPSIIMYGKSKIKLQILSHYTDSGFVATDNYTKHLILYTTGHIDSSKRGDQTIVYTAKDSEGNITTLKRIVTVDDYIPPTLSFPFDTLIWDVYKPFTDPVAIVNDNYYKVNQSNVHRVNDAAYSVDVSKLGYYKVIYYASDPSRNFSLFDTIVVHVVDRVPPMITLTEDTIVYLHRWENFYDLNSYSVSDNIDPDAEVIETGDYLKGSYGYIYFNKTGLHLVNYKAVDFSGNVSQSVVRFFYISERASVMYDKDDNMRFDYYPNPAKDQVIINYSSGNTENISINICDITGKQLVKLYDGPASELNKSYNTSNLSAGIYILNLYSNGRAWSNKLIISR